MKHTGYGGNSIITPVAQRLLRNTTFLAKYRIYTTWVRNANCRMSSTVISMHQEVLAIIMYYKWCWKLMVLTHKTFSLHQFCIPHVSANIINLKHNFLAEPVYIKELWLPFILIHALLVRRKTIISTGQVLGYLPESLLLLLPSACRPAVRISILSTEAESFTRTFSSPTVTTETWLVSCKCWKSASSS